MTNVIFNSGFIGFLICVLLFADSTAALAREVLDGSLPDALGRPVDHSGGGRHLPSERTGNETEVVPCPLGTGQNKLPSPPPAD